jgi:hypothetical protein
LGSTDWRTSGRYAYEDADTTIAGYYDLRYNSVRVGTGHL